MATQRQIEANRLNATRSTGPKTDEGKARSRANATRHGMAAGLDGPDASPEFLRRREAWAAEQKPVGESAGWALDRAVAASLRVERCERAVDALCQAQAGRARLAWHEDRAVEAAATFGRLARDPVLASARLWASAAGALLMIEAWCGLVAALETGSDWTEAEAAKALDLLGVAADLRAGRTLVDDPEGGDPVAFRRLLALGELERLEALRDEALVPLDEHERAVAMRGDVALLSKPAKLILRYERDAWRRYREAMKQLKAEAEAPPAQPARPACAPPPEPVDLDDEGAEDAWLDRLERSLEARGLLAPERSQFAGVGADRGAMTPPVFDPRGVLAPA